MCNQPIDIESVVKVCFYYQRDQYQFGDAILALLVFGAEIGLVIPLHCNFGRLHGRTAVWLCSGPDDVLEIVGWDCNT